MMHITLFEDSGVDLLAPMTLLRPAYTLRSGSLSLLDWVREQGLPVCSLVRNEMESWQAAECPTFASGDCAGRPRLLINSRLVPCSPVFDTLQLWKSHPLPGLVFQGETLVMGWLPAEAPALPSSVDPESLRTYLERPEILQLPVLEQPLPLFNYPHDLVRAHLDVLGDNLQRRLRSGEFREIRDGVFAAGNVELADWAHTDTTDGPIVLDVGVVVRPFACLRGPLYVGPLGRVNEHAVLKGGVSVGTMAKVGGEIEASVIDDYSSKQHAGYLGHSYLGQWVNWGAGTSNSNLKNTYGSIKIDVNEQRIDTGLQFFGTCVGDFSRTAINTSIFTGKLVGVCSTLYGFVTTNVPSFVNYARSFGEVTELSPTVMAELQRRVFARRGVSQMEWHRQHLQTIYGRLAAGRQLADRPVSL